MRFIKIFLILLFIFSLQSIHALDVSITDKAAEACLHGGYDRSTYYNGAISLAGELELNSIYLFRGGFSFGQWSDTTELKAFTTARVSPFNKIPLNFSASWIYNGLTEYEADTHSILPMVSYTFGNNLAGISLGMNLRFASFFGEPAQFESIITFFLFYNIINKDTLRLSINFGNYNEFNPGNMGAFVFSFDVDARINENWKIINKIEILQSGADGFSTNLYGFAWKGGVRFSW